MTRHFVLLAALTAALCSCNRLPAAFGSRLISQTTAARHGLARPWFNQVQLDPGRTRVTHIMLHEGNGPENPRPDTLFVQTDRGAIHAIDAETGQTLWVKLVGRPDDPSMPVGTNNELVAVVSGSHLYVLDRSDGKMLWKRRVDGVPVAGVVMSQRWAYVPMISGRVFAYRLKKRQQPSENGERSQKTEKKQEQEEEVTPSEQIQPEEEEGKKRESIRLDPKYTPPAICNSFGRITSEPILTRNDGVEEYLSWTTVKGMFSARLNNRKKGSFTVNYQLATASEIVSQPTLLHMDPNVAANSAVIFSASRDGAIHARLENQGTELWRLAVGEPIVEPVVPIGRRVYVATQLGGMYCLKADSGEKIWWVPQIVQFIAASPKRIYAADKLGRILVLDAKTGARTDTIALAAGVRKLLNLNTDRIYLVTETGLIQCLHEVELSEPIHHRKSPAKASDKPGEKKDAAEEDAQEPGDENLTPPGGDPFSSSEPDDNPFG